MARRTLVFGPAYLDRVVHVDRPLVDPALGPPLDQSVDGRWEFGEGLTLIDPIGSRIVVELPGGWPGPTGVVRLVAPAAGRPPALAAGGERALLARRPGGDGRGLRRGAGGRAGQRGRPRGRSDQPRRGRPAGACRDRAPAGPRAGPARRLDLARDQRRVRRQAPDRVPRLPRRAGVGPPEATSPCDLRVVASLPNRLAARRCAPPAAAVRFFAPAMRNMLDRDPPLSDFAEAIDILSCNRREWESLADREEVAWRVPVLAITDGPRGSIVRFTTPAGGSGPGEGPGVPQVPPAA